LDSSVDKIRHFYSVAQARKAREGAAEQLRLMHSIGHAVASLLDKKAAAGYKAQEQALLAVLEGKDGEQNQQENVGEHVQRLLQAGARRKYTGHA
jgi:hypothetical protein